jgi:hypothetical protein
MKGEHTEPCNNHRQPEPTPKPEVLKRCQASC